jgi:PAS domain-containing protein
MYRSSEWHSKAPLPLRYAAGVLLAVAAQLVQLPLDPPALVPYIAYIPFMAVSAWFGGFGPGLVTAAVCTLESMYFSTPPIGSFRVGLLQDWIGLGSFALSALVIGVLFEQLKRVRQAHAIAEEDRVKLSGELGTRKRVLESIVQNSPTAIAVLSGPEFTFATVNPAYESLAPGEPMVGRAVADVFPEAAPQILPLLRVVREAETVYHSTAMAVPLRRGPGSVTEERYFNFSYLPVSDLDGDGGAGVLVVAIEVTEQKNAEKELRTAYTELAAIYANAPVILLVVDEDLRVEKLNDLGVRFTGHQMSELLGMRTGGALRCVEALADPRGCGYGPACTRCSLRLAIVDSVQNGTRHEGVEVWMPFASSSGRQEQRCLLVHRPFAFRSSP